MPTCTSSRLVSLRCTDATQTSRLQNIYCSTGNCMWPEPTPLRDKLYGNLEELRRTAAFGRATGISVKRTTSTKKKCCGTDTVGLILWD